MLLLLKNKFVLFVLGFALAVAASPIAEAKGTQKQKHNKYCLVPPPPPYVPSMLPELSQQYRGYGQGYSTNSIDTSSGVYKPNKYLTYYFPKKGSQIR